MNAKEEKAYQSGSAATYRELLHVAVRGLRGCGEVSDTERAVLILADVEAQLRSWCDSLGIEVPDNLHPSDIIEKRLRRHYGD